MSPKTLFFNCDHHILYHDFLLEIDNFTNAYFFLTGIGTFSLVLKIFAIKTNRFKHLKIEIEYEE